MKVRELIADAFEHRLRRVRRAWSPPHKLYPRGARSASAGP